MVRKENRADSLFFGSPRAHPQELSLGGEQDGG